MKYCTRCGYPENHPFNLTFDDEGVCSGCRIHEEKDNIDWDERKEMLREVLEKYRCKDGSNYDCIIPVSGGKDSHYQVYLIREVFGLTPLLVTFNHGMNTKRGLRNLQNIVARFDCDHIRYTLRPSLFKKLAGLSMKKMGDMCWHCHAGITTYPVQIAVKFKVPLIIWGENQWSDYVGMFSLNDLVEMTKKVRKEHGLRGYDYEDMINEKEGITKSDLKPFIYPSDEDLEEVGVRGIYINNFIRWDAKEQTELMIKEYGFESGPQERSWNCYENVECFHCSGAHDYLKYLKFGYGRATDHAVLDIRLGRTTREEVIPLIEKYDSKRPSDIDIFLKWIGMTEEEFEKCIEPMRDPRAWEKDEKGKWILKDSLSNHINDPEVDKVRLPLKNNGDNKYILTPTPQPKGDDEYILM